MAVREAIRQADPYGAYEFYTDQSANPEIVPNIIRFVASNRFLNRPNLYPRQATLLKLIFLQKELLTDYDYEVIEEWTTSYVQTADESGEGNNGIQPDVLERVDICIAEGRNWFREVLAVAGRRGSKGHVGALSGAYVLWNYVAKSDPQGHYGVDRSKKLAAFVFAGKKEQAKVNQWRDLYHIITEAPCFTPYISKPLGEHLSVYAPHDFVRMAEMRERGIETGDDMATFEIIPKESTGLSGRGPASFMQFYDEAGHVVKAVAKADAEDVYEAATPALDQFGVDAFIYIPSSPWQKIGLLYTKYQQSIERMLDEGGVEVPAYPEMLMFQLTSWDIYKDWERAHTLEMWPGGPRFMRLHGAIQEYDEQMRRLERANPEKFRVERKSHFAAALDAYLREENVKRIWQPWEGRTFTQQDRGILAVTYRAHGDPSKSGANFGFAIGHVEGPDERGLPHVVFDVITHWEPGDFPETDYQIDYDFIDGELEGYLDRFMPAELTFDQFNSVNTIQRLTRHARKMGYPKRVEIYERPATGPLNWKTYETFKTAVGLNLVHGPYYEQADLELIFLQDMGGKVEPPTSGPVQTKDVADCMAIVVYELIGEHIAALVGQSLSDLPLRAMAEGGVNPHAPRASEDEEVHSALSNFSRARPGRVPRRRR